MSRNREENYIAEHVENKENTDILEQEIPAVRKLGKKKYIFWSNKVKKYMANYKYCL